MIALMSETRPILYSFRRCPYAIRARMVLIDHGIDFELREIDLRNKPEAFLQLSPKGTVPVLVLPSGKIIDESLAIVDYVLDYKHDDATEALIAELHATFNPAHKRLKFRDRYDDVDIAHEESIVNTYLAQLDALLANSDYLFSDHMEKVDVAVFPFVRQLYVVGEDAFRALPFDHLKRWFFTFIDSALLHKVMAKSTSN
ncbi:MAG: glutathione S-transferase [Coxiella sp. (in: Bacteria)]|nr:MAG: glutathione S-transferase [Coxiella sp. (in: g-proteobacteria)]